MLPKARLILALPLVLGLAACMPPDESKRAGVEVQPHVLVDQLPDLSAEAGFTGVVVYGDKGYTGLVGSAPYPSIRVDGLPVGKCQKRRAFVIALAPGPHQVSAHSENKVVHDITLNEGEVAYFRCNYMRIGGLFLPPAVLAPADAETARAVVNGN